MSVPTRLQRRLSAIVLADVSGYSRLMQLDEEGTHRRWQGHLAAAARLAGSGGGRIVKLTGDGFMAEFASVVEAARASLAWLAHVAAEEAGVDEARRIAVRVGLHLGDIIERPDGEWPDLYGDGVNLAARLEQAAPPGTVCVSEATRAHLVGRVEADFRDLGVQTLKNIAAPLHVWAMAPLGTGVGAGDSRASPAARARMRRLSILAGLGLLACVGGVATSMAVGWSPGFVRYLPFLAPTPMPVERLSIVVLPFANASGREEDAFLADALTEDLVADLSRIADAFVISSSTSFTFRDSRQSAAEVARQLGVAFAVSGGVRRAGDRIRVSASLVDAHSDGVLWSEQYDRTRADLFSLQQQLTGRIARTLNLALKEAASRRSLRGAPADLDAQDYALRAWAEVWTKPQSRATNEAALAYVDRALALDPDNADALASRCYALARAARYGWRPGAPEDVLAEAVAAGERATALDPRNADAFFVLAFAVGVSGDTERSLALYARAQQLNPNHAPAFANYGFTLAQAGRPAEAAAWVAKAMAISPRDPLLPIWHSILSFAAVLTGDDDKALQAAEAAIALNPRHPAPYLHAAVALARLGRTEEAKVMMARHDQMRPNWTIARQRASSAASPAFEAFLDRLRALGLPET